MSRRTRIAIAALLLLLAAAALWWRTEPEETPREPPASPASQPAATPRETPRPRPRARGEGSDPSADAGAEVAPTVSAPTFPSGAAKWPIRVLARIAAGTVVTSRPPVHVAVRVRYFGGEEDPEPLTKAVEIDGFAAFAGFELPPRHDPPATIEVEARADGYMTTRASGEGREFVLRLVPGVAIRGRVVDAGGAPVARADVALPGTLAVTNDDGTFEAFALGTVPAEVVLRVDHRAFLTWEGRVRAPADDVRVVLERGLCVTGRVAFPDGSAVPGVSVADGTGSRRSATDANGRYALSGLDEGEVAVKCTFVPHDRTVLAGATGVDFVVDVPLARVRIVDAEGRPLRRGLLGTRHRIDGETFGDFGVSGAFPIELFSGQLGAALLVGVSADGYADSVATVEFGREARLHEVLLVAQRKPESGAPDAK